MIDALLTYRSENTALRLFLESLLQAHPSRQAALERLAQQLADAKEQALFHALPDEEIEEFRVAGERLLSELGRAR